MLRALVSAPLPPPPLPPTGAAGAGAAAELHGDGARLARLAGLAHRSAWAPGGRERPGAGAGMTAGARGVCFRGSLPHLPPSSCSPAFLPRPIAAPRPLRVPCCLAAGVLGMGVHQQYEGQGYLSALVGFGPELQARWGHMRTLLWRQPQHMACPSARLSLRPVPHTLHPPTRSAR